MLQVAKRVVAQPFDENCYIVYDDATDKALIVDPGGNATELETWINEMGWHPVAILLTHTHCDHIGAVDALRDAFAIPVYVPAGEADYLGDPRLNLSGLFPGPSVTARPAEYTWTAEDLAEQQVDDFTFSIRSAPGHSPDHMMYVFDEAGFVICGDVIFNGSVGRTDLPGGDGPTLMQSIRSQVYTLPDAMRLYPGHGAATTVAAERQSNPFNVYILSAD